MENMETITGVIIIIVVFSLKIFFVLRYAQGKLFFFNTIVFMCVTSTLRNIFYEYFSVESV